LEQHPPKTKVHKYQSCFFFCLSQEVKPALAAPAAYYPEQAQPLFSKSMPPLA
jgi:hypothetical protein